MTDAKKDYSKEPITLNETFIELFDRLEILGDYKGFFNTWECPDPLHYSTTRISRNIYKFPTEDVIKLTKIALKEIEVLMNKEKAILNKTRIIDIDEYDDPELREMDILFRTKDEVKERVYTEIRLELLFYKTNLEIILQDLYTSENSLKDKNIETKVEIIIGDDFKFSQLKQIGNTILDKYQTALLFDYLRKKELILRVYEENNDALSKLVAALTGHSDQNLRTKDGFGAIANIKSDNLKNKLKADSSNYNLNVVRKALLLIISQIDEDIMTENKRVQKK